MYFESEADYQEALAKYLSCTGWDVEVEITFKAANGQTSRLDILATKGNHTLLIEAKKDAERAKVNSAIHQLIRYSSKFPDAELWFACPDTLTDVQKTKLISYGIKPIPTEHLPLEKYRHVPATVFKGKVIRQNRGFVAAIVKRLPKDLQLLAVAPVRNRMCMTPMCGGNLEAVAYTLHYQDDFVESFMIHAQCQKCKAKRDLMVHKPNLEAEKRLLQLAT